MTKLEAITGAITNGFWNRDQLSLEEFEILHGTDAIAKRKLAIELVAHERQDFKRQVEALAAKV